MNGPGGPEVLESTGSLSSWQALVTGNALASSPLARACDPGPLTAVGYVPASTSRSAAGATPASPVVGTSCRRPGVVGIFEELRWQLADRGTNAPTRIRAGPGPRPVLDRGQAGRADRPVRGPRCGTRRDEPASSLVGHQGTLGQFRPLAASQGRPPAVLRCDAQGQLVRFGCPARRPGRTCRGGSGEHRLAAATSTTTRHDDGRFRARLDRRCVSCRPHRADGVATRQRCGNMGEAARWSTWQSSSAPRVERPGTMKGTSTRAAWAA